MKFRTANPCDSPELLARYERSRVRDAYAFGGETRSPVCLRVYSIYKPRLYFTITAADCATCTRYDFMRTVKHLKICLTIDTQTSAAIAPLQYTYHRYFSPHTHISHSTDYAIASLSSRSHAGIDLIDTVTGDLESLR